MKEPEAPESLFPSLSSSKKKAKPIPFHPSRGAQALMLSFLGRVPHLDLPQNSSKSGIWPTSQSGFEEPQIEKTTTIEAVRLQLSDRAPAMEP